MHEKVESGAVRGYTPDPQYYQRQQPQGAVVYERYATSEQITTMTPQQHQQAHQFRTYQAPVYQQQPAYQPQPVQRKGGGFLEFIKRRDVVVLIGAIICTVWLLISYNIIGDLLNANQPGDTAEELGAALGTAIGAAMIELHTGRFANTLGDERASETARLIEAAELAHSLGIEVHAGHGIQIANLAELAAVPHLTELNIGHTLICRAIFTGLTEAVREMKSAIDSYSW